MVRVVAWRVQDRYADGAVRVDYSLPVSRLSSSYSITCATPSTVPQSLHHSCTLPYSTLPRPSSRRNNTGSPTVRMPHVARKPHGRRRERIVLGKLELGGEDAALEGRALGALDQCFPHEDVVFGDGACGDAFGRVVGERAVFVEEALGGDAVGHSCGGLGRVRVRARKWCEG